MAWRVAIETRDRPVVLALTRQNVPTLDRTEYAPGEGRRRGGYVLADPPYGSLAEIAGEVAQPRDPHLGSGKPDLILIATGSEVQLIVEARKRLSEQGIGARLVSLPSWELFDAEPQEYREAVLPPSVRARLAVEAGVPQGWCKYVGDEGEVIGLGRFGASAPYKVIMEEFGFTVDNVVDRATKLAEKQRQ